MVTEMPILVVPRRGEIGSIDLQQEARSHNSAIFGLHHVGERRHIGVFGRVMQVNDEAR
jgi:hypothetical protein